MTTIHRWVVRVLIVVVISVLINISFLQRPRELADSTSFAGSIFIRLLFGATIPTAFYGAATVAFSPTARSDWWVTLVLATLGVGAIAYWPRHILADPHGITQAGILGIGSRTIRWEDVDYATENLESGGIEVVPKEDKKMVLSPLLIGYAEFLTIVRSHCRVW